MIAFHPSDAMNTKHKGHENEVRFLDVGGRIMAKATEGAELSRGNPPLFLRVPCNVGEKLAKDAKKAKTTVQAVVLGILAVHYDIEVTAPRRGKPKHSPPTFAPSHSDE